MKHSPIVLLGLSTLLGCDLILGVEDRNPAGTTGATGGGDTNADVATSTAAEGAGSTAASTAGSGGDGGEGGQADTASTTVTGGGGASCSPDLDVDPRHCGTCERDCLEGDCEDGRCQPFALSFPLTAAEYKSLLVEDGANGEIYFARWRVATEPAGVIYRMEKGGEAPLSPTALESLPSWGWVGDLKLDESHVYYTNYSDSDSDPVRGVYRVPRMGGEAEQLVFDDPALTYLGAAEIALDGDDLYFKSWFGRVALGKSTRTGDDVTPIWDLGTEPPYYEAAVGLLVDDGWIYVSGVDAGIVRYPTSGGSPETIYDALESGGGFTSLFDLSGGFLYWTDGDGFLRHAPVDGSGPVDVVAGDVARDVAVRDGWLYFITDDQRAIHRVPVDDLQSTPEVVATSLDGEPISALAFDESSIFWLSYFHGQVYQLVL